jgi:hypothetical protein
VTRADHERLPTLLDLHLGHVVDNDLGHVSERPSTATSAESRDEVNMRMAMIETDYFELVSGAR